MVKKIFGVLTILLLFLCIFIPKASAANYLYYAGLVTTGDSNLNVREKASTSSNKISSLENN